MSAHDEERQRARLLGRMRQYLVRQRSPRAILVAIMLATAVAGFLASVGLLKAGLVQMWLRYPLAVLVAWGVFLFLVWQWAARERDSIRVDEELARVAAENEEAFADRKSVWPGRAPETIVHRSDRSGCLDLLDFGSLLDADPEGCLVLVAVIIVVGLALGAVVTIGGLIMEADVLLAEVLLDTLLVSALYRRLRRKEPDWWRHGALRQTAWPVLATMGSLMIAGIFLQYYAPEAHSIGAAWRHFRLSHGW